MRYLTVDEVLALHRRLIEQSGGSHGVRDLAAVQSAVAQPRQTFGGEDLYPSLAFKAGALGFSLIQNHPFVDGNKRIGHAGIEVMLVLNGFELEADVDEQERIILAVASGQLRREDFTSWIEQHLRRLS